MYWIEPEGYQQWYFFKSNKREKVRRLLFWSLSVISAWVLLLAFRDNINEFVTLLLVLVLVFPLIASLVLVIQFIQVYLNAGLELTEIRLDSFGIFSGENIKGRDKSILIDDILKYSIVPVSWRNYHFHNLIIVKKDQGEEMFGIDEFDLKRLRNQIDFALTKDCS